MLSLPAGLDLSATIKLQEHSLVQLLNTAEGYKDKDT